MLSALHQVAAAASESLDLDRVFETAIEQITAMFRFATTRIHTYDERAGELLLRASFASDPDRFTAAKSFARGQGIVGKVAESGKPLIFGDVQTDPLYQSLSRTKVSGQFGYHFFAVFPIRGKLKTLGTLGCVGATPRKLSAGEIQFLEAIADRIAVAMENSELYEQLRQNLKELQQKTAELEKANKIKGEFLSVMSHELRTPLNVIMGYAVMVKEKMLGEINHEQEKVIGKVIGSSKDLLVMINGILEATKIEAGAAMVRKEEVSLSHFLDEIKTGYEMPLGKNLSISWNYPCNLPIMKTDGDKLRHILQNLINNALKFTEQGSVTVSARIKGNGMPTPKPSRCIEFKVEDTGVGIPEDSLPAIFEKFRQIDSSETRVHGGVGLGLYIVKKFTELLGGEIEVQSEPGKGSTFTVTIPYGDYPSRRAFVDAGLK
jgi:signal transduction histidine kinase